MAALTRFFVEPECLDQEHILLEGDNAAHAKVLRLKTGEQVLVCDGQGSECLCRIEDADSGVYRLCVLEKRTSSSEPAAKVSVYMALPKADKLEHVIQKATELGAYEVVTFPTSRCVSKPDEKSLKKKVERWEKIAASAAEQSGRGMIPKVIALNSYKQALQRAAEADLSILFYENEHATTLHQVLSSREFQTASIISGPEGGFDEAEVLEAEELGIRICTLGSRILRCETAPLCGLSAIMYHIGEF